MFSERTKKNTIALSVTIIVNFVVCFLVAYKAQDAIFWVGLGFAPIFGGIFRSIVAFKKDVIPIILITATIDIFVLIPLINYVCDILTREYVSGMIVGAPAGLIMMITGFLTLAIRNKIERDIKPGSVQKCPKCNSEMKVEEEQELIDLLSEQAKELGSEVEIISVDSREGEQFSQIGGIGAILRYKLS